MHQKLLFFVSLIILLQTTHAQTTYLFIGTYTDGKPDKGIYIYQFNTKNGRLKSLSTAENITNPSYITIAPNGRFLYACTDTRLPNAGSVTAFKIDSIHGTLSLLNKQATNGENPAYVNVHKDNHFVISANYTGGSVSVFNANADGSLNSVAQVITFIDSSINKTRQEKSHIHSAVFSPDYHYIYLPDLGADKIRAFQWEVNESQPLIPADHLLVKTTPGSGPRHFTFHPNQPFAYCVEELSGTVTAYSYQNGKLDAIQSLFAYATKRDSAYSGADIHASPDGRFLYASNRGENRIAIFSIHPTNGTLQLIGHQSTYGNHPRNFTIDPTGRFLLVANQMTSNIVVFKRNGKTGLLTRKKGEIKVPNPSCLQMRTYGK